MTYPAPSPSLLPTNGQHDEVSRPVPGRVGLVQAAQVLREAGGRPSAAIRAGDTAVRIGGDEFVILYEQIEDVAQVREVAERISAGFGNCFVIGEHRVRLSTSVGITLGNWLWSSEVLRRADDAMYRSKRRGHGLVDMQP